MPYSPRADSPGVDPAVALVAEIKDLLSQRQSLHDKLARVEENKSSVHPAVYEKVKREYHGKLAELEERLKPRLEHAESEAARLRGALATLETSLTEATESLEEARFRNTLNEFAPGEFQQVEAQKLHIMEEARDRLSVTKEQLGVLDRALAGRLKSQPINPPTLPLQTGHDFSAPAPPAIVKPESKPHTAPVVATEMEHLFGAEAASPSQAPSPVMNTAVPAHEVAPRDLPSPRPERSVVDFPQKAPARYVPVVIVKDKDNREETYDLHAGQTLIGRAPENDIILLEENVSRRHCRLLVEGESTTLEDLGSSNGTFVNAERLKPRSPRRLEDNDVLKFGKTLALFRTTSED